MLLELTVPLYSISILSGKLDVIKLKNGLGLIWQVKKNICNTFWAKSYTYN